MGRTESHAPGYAPPLVSFDPRIDDFVPKPRKYVHFDLQLSETEREAVKADSSEIEGHEFWPLLGFTIEERRAKVELDTSLKKVVKFKRKPRDIRFGSHRDAAILQKYSKRLGNEYEKTLKDRGLHGVVLAYRSDVGNNVSQAKALFEEITERGDCVFLGLDISGFFDHIRHDVLREQLAETLKDGFLPKDHFTIFKNVTRYCWVDTQQVYDALGRKGPRNGRICNAFEFRTMVRPRGILQVNLESFGIPQGTPVSGLYANISMLHFDTEANNLATSMGGSYRRYSDDLAFLLPPEVLPEEFIGQVKSLLANIGLEISERKTEVAVFTRDSKLLSCSGRCQYLGFTFDGVHIRVRESSLQRY